MRIGQIVKPEQVKANCAEFGLSTWPRLPRFPGLELLVPRAVGRGGEGCLGETLSYILMLRLSMRRL